MKKYSGIIVDEKHMEDIKSAIESAEKRARVRTICIRDILDAIREIEKQLGVPKKCLEGVSYDVDLYAGPFPSAYKYRPESTKFTLAYEGGKWRVSYIHRGYTRTGCNDTYILNGDTLPECTLAAIVNRLKAF